MRWETDFGAAELSHLNLYDRTVEGLVLKDVPGARSSTTPRPARARTTPATSSTASWSWRRDLPPQREPLEGSIVRLEALEPVHETASPRWPRRPRSGPGWTARSGRARGFRPLVRGAARGQPGGREWCFATLRGDGAAIGSSSFWRSGAEHDGLEIGWTWLAPSAWRSGANLEAKLLMLRFAFEELGCMRVEFKTDARNERSRAALEALRATFEGIFRKHMLMRGMGFATRPTSRSPTRSGRVWGNLERASRLTTAHPRRELMAESRARSRSERSRETPRPQRRTWRPRCASRIYEREGPLGVLERYDEHFHPAAVWEPAVSAFGAEDYVGRDGMRRWIDDMEAVADRVHPDHR